MLSSITAILALCVSLASGLRVVLTNDDGWAEANNRAQFASLVARGYDVVQAAPAENQSGRGSLEFPVLPRILPCQFDSCPALSPAQGTDSSNPRLNYINSTPVTSVKYGIEVLAPRFFSGNKPDFIVSGPNVGSNLDIQNWFSGTVGAATEGARQGIPSVAFSGASGDARSFTALRAGDYSAIYAELATKLVDQLVSTGKPYLPPGVALNVNFPEVDANCTSASQFKFVLTKILPDILPGNFDTKCGNKLPQERVVVWGGKCLSSVTVFDADNKFDADSIHTEDVYQKLAPILACS